MFAAVLDRTRRWAPFRSKHNQHNVCVVIVTDERGDDYVVVEDLARNCARRGVVVYCLGSVAPFAAEHGDRFFTPPDGRRFRIRIDRGPESVILESLPLFLPRGMPDERRLISSGFGPYGLCRLCVETGGEFLIVEDEWPHVYEPGGKQCVFCLMSFCPLERTSMRTPLDN